MVEIRDHSFQAAVTSMMSEVYKLAIKHVQLSARTHPHPKDIQCALKVALLPSYTYRSTMKRVSHVEDLETMKSDENMRARTIESMTMVGRLMGKMSADKELNNDDGPAVKQCKQVQKAEAEKLERERQALGQQASLFPKPQRLSGSQVAAAIGTIGALLQATDMPDEAAEDFCWCSDAVQAEHNDMFLMERADELWAEYMEETSELDRDPFENAMIGAIQRVDQEYTAAEARARARWEEMVQEEMDRNEDQDKDQGRDQDQGDN